MRLFMIQLTVCTLTGDARAMLEAVASAVDTLAYDAGKVPSTGRYKASLLDECRGHIDYTLTADEFTAWGVLLRDYLADLCKDDDLRQTVLDGDMWCDLLIADGERFEPVEALRCQQATA